MFMITALMWMIQDEYKDLWAYDGNLWPYDKDLLAYKVDLGVYEIGL